MTTSQPLRESDILFPSASTSIKTTLLDLKRSNLSIQNRLASISADGAFVAKVAGTFQLPLIANERCGSWYIDPVLKAGSAYFKSTDGHFGEWSFSLRRLNLGVLEVVGGAGG
jgi:tRNA A64-2'-O-ribosylphosphate transferase